MRQRLVSINSRTEIPEGKGFSPAWEGRELAQRQAVAQPVYWWLGFGRVVTPAPQEKRWRVHNSVVRFAYGSWYVGWLAFFASFKEFAGEGGLIAEKAGKGKCSFLKVCNRYSETDIISQWELSGVWTTILLVLVGTNGLIEPLCPKYKVPSLKGLKFRFQFGCLWKFHLSENKLGGGEWQNSHHIHFLNTQITESLILLILIEAGLDPYLGRMMDCRHTKHRERQK